MQTQPSKVLTTDEDRRLFIEKYITAENEKTWYFLLCNTYLCTLILW